MFSGTYTLSKKNQRLSDLIKSAGGVNDRGYVAGARLERKVNESERARMEAVLQKKPRKRQNRWEIEAAKENKKIDLKDSEQNQEI